MVKNNFKNPYKDSYPLGVENFPFSQGDKFKLSKNLTLGEIRLSSFVSKDEKPFFSYAPVHTNLIKAFQLLRDTLKSPIIVNSSFRSVSHELFKKRSGTSKHTQGIAFDLRGDGLVDLLLEALEKKNHLYDALRSLGVNGFGIYKEENFIHIDMRPAKVGGGYAVWYGEDDAELKKKVTFIHTLPLLLVVSVVVVLVGVYKKLKDWRR